jgi:hypothetical protein
MKGKALKVSGLLAVLMVLVTGNTMASSLQAMGAGWEAGDSGTTYGFGLRGTLGDVWALDLGWTYFGEGDDVHINIPGDNDVNLGGINANVFDLGVRFTLPMELYFGGGLSYFDFDHDTASISGEWGVYGLMGWSFGSDHVRSFIEGMYRYTEGTIRYDNHHFEGTVDRDVSHDGLGVTVGLMYRF